MNTAGRPAPLSPPKCSRCGEQWASIAIRGHRPGCDFGICRCGHPRQVEGESGGHFRGDGECMAFSEDETWACGCEAYEPSESVMPPLRNDPSASDERGSTDGGG